MQLEVSDKTKKRSGRKEKPNLSLFNFLDGGAVFVDVNSNLTISYSRIIQCNAKVGGAIGSNGGSVSISNSVIKDCSSEMFGGALFIQLSVIRLKSVNMTGCHAKDRGGAGIITASNLLMEMCAVEFCTSFSGGGAIFTYKTDVLLNMTSFSHNSVVISKQTSGKPGGGALFTQNSSLQVVHCLFTNNSVYSHNDEISGGAIFALASKNLLIFRTTFTGNFISGRTVYGGALAIITDISGRVDVYVLNSTFNRNFAQGTNINGGVISAMHPALTGDMYLNYTIFLGNSVFGVFGTAAFGAVINLKRDPFGGTGYIFGSHFISNIAAVFSLNGGIQLFSGNFDVSNCTFVGFSVKGSVILTNIYLC